MKINSIGTMSYNQTAHSIKPMAQNFGGTPKLHHAGKTMKALAAAAILGMAAVGMSSCVQPTDPTQIEKPAEDSEVEDSEVEDSEVEDSEVEDPEVEDPEVEDPEVEDPEVEDPEIEDPEVEDPEIEDPEVEDPEIEETPFIVNDTISPALAATDEYKLLREVGFSHIEGVDVPEEAGKYQPKTGEITELHYTAQGMNIINFKLNRDLSKDGKLVYDGTNYDVVYGPEEMEKWTGDEFLFDAKNKVLTKHDQDEDKHYYTSIKMQDDGSLVMSKYDKDTVDGVPNNYREILYEFDNTKVNKFDSSNKYEDSIWKDTTSPYYSSAYYTNISFKLAK